MLEVAIENRVTRWARLNGWLVEKVRFANAGYPDRIYFGYGHCILIEYKRPPYEPEPLQNERISELKKRGILATWADHERTAIRILKAAMATPRIPAAGHLDGVADVLRTAVRPGLGQNVHHAGGNQDSRALGVRKTRARGRT